MSPLILNTALYYIILYLTCNTTSRTSLENSVFPSSAQLSDVTSLCVFQPTSGFQIFLTEEISSRTGQGANAMSESFAFANICVDTMAGSRVR